MSTKKKGPNAMGPIKGAKKSGGTKGQASSSKKGGPYELKRSGK